MKTAHPYLNFPGDTEAAFEFYRSVFGGDFAAVVRFKDIGGEAMGIPEHELDKIAHIALPLGEGIMLMGTDVLESQAMSLIQGDNFYICLEPDGAEEAETLFNALATNGKVEMPLQTTDWAEAFGTCMDSFGIQWMISYTGNVQFVAPTG